MYNHIDYFLSAVRICTYMQAHHLPCWMPTLVFFFLTLTVTRGKADSLVGKQICKLACLKHVDLVIGIMILVILGRLFFRAIY